MLRTTTLSLLLAGSASAYTLARGPSALSVRPALAKPAQFAPLVRMAEAAASEAAAPVEAPCIEDEAIEECVLASWDAGKITLPMPVVEKLQLFTFIFGWFFLNVMCADGLAPSSPSPSHRPSAPSLSPRPRPYYRPHQVQH